MPDAIFEDPRLAQVYDPLDPDRRDLDVYVDLVGDVALMTANVAQVFLTDDDWSATLRGIVDSDPRRPR